MKKKVLANTSALLQVLIIPEEEKDNKMLSRACSCEYLDGEHEILEKMMWELLDKHAPNRSPIDSNIKQSTPGYIFSIFMA